MEVVNLRCNNCGNNLSINDNVKFFTCSYCKSSLTIKRSGNVSYTEVLEKIESNTETLLNNSQTNLVENEIARLDREWTIEREKYKIRGKGGSSIPSKNTGLITIIPVILTLVLFVIFLVQFMSSTSRHGGPPGLVILISFVYVIFFIGWMVSHRNKADKYFEAEKEYKAAREKLLKELK